MSENSDGILKTVLSSEACQPESGSPAMTFPFWSVPPQAVGTPVASREIEFDVCPLFRVPSAWLRTELLVEQRCLPLASAPSS